MSDPEDHSCDIKADQGEPACKQLRISNQEMKAPEYILENGFRKVIPYMYTYRCHAKGRWVNRKIVEVFNSEMCPRGPDFVENSINLGRLKVNGKPITETYVVGENDKIENLIHRHESPVLDCKIHVVEEDDDVVVLNKPCSLPVHCCGGYNKNTILHLLKERGYTNLRATHRLDRQTSGVLVLARNSTSDQKWKKFFRDGLVYKEYLARVEGHFPKEEQICNQSLEKLVVSMGIQRCSDTGKACVTRFVLVKECGSHSIVKCFPETGRTHQIRVHLQYLGFPIVNDPLYNCSYVFGPNKGKDGDFAGKSFTQMQKELKDKHSFSHWRTSNDSDIDKNNLHVDEHCPDCKLTPVEPTLQSLVMDLHCLKLTTPERSYESPYPSWAL